MQSPTSDHRAEERQAAGASGRSRRGAALLGHLQLLHWVLRPGHRGGRRHGHGADAVPGAAVQPAKHVGALRRSLDVVVGVLLLRVRQDRARIGHRHRPDVGPGLAPGILGGLQLVEGYRPRIEGLGHKVVADDLWPLADGAARAELGHLLLRVPRLGEDLVRVLADPRRRVPVVHLRAGELHRRPDEGHRLLTARDVHLDQHFTRQDVRVGEHLVGVQDGGAAHPSQLQLLQPPGRLHCLGDLVQRWRDVPPVDHTGPHGGEPLVLQEVLSTSHLAELPELLIVRGGQYEITVLRGHDLVGHHVGVVVPDARLPLLLRQVVHALVLHQRHRDIQH
mmetsp:Transcript_85703/g.239345  ORF Transcript_85703/g.239345 Transcript_85703/m.239345 type:complete len:336 (-) Transcript_85703:522-1529(-)